VSGSPGAYPRGVSRVSGVRAGVWGGAPRSCRPARQGRRLAWWLVGSGWSRVLRRSGGASSAGPCRAGARSGFPAGWACGGPVRSGTPRADRAARDPTGTSHPTPTPSSRPGLSGPGQQSVLVAAWGRRPRGCAGRRAGCVGRREVGFVEVDGRGRRGEPTGRPGALAGLGPRATRVSKGNTGEQGQHG